MTIAKEPAVNQHRLDAIDGETLMTTPLPPIRFTLGGPLIQIPSESGREGRRGTSSPSKAHPAALVAAVF